MRRFRSVLAVGLLWVAAADAAGSYVEYLHVEAGSGMSGGGHAALRIGGTTYHYVYAEPGLLTSRAESNDDFDYAYRAIGNRGIHVSRIGVSTADYNALAEAFTRRHITEQAQLELLDAAREDRDYTTYFQAQRCGVDEQAAGSSAPRLRGAGYFVAAAQSDGAEYVDSAIHDLREAIERQYGADYLAQRRRILEQEARGLAPTTPPGPVIREWAMPAPPDGIAVRYRALATAAVAIDVLLGERVPAPAAFRSVGEATQPLSGAELALLEARVRALQSALVRLAASPRRDWGFPMLVGLARLVAIEASLRTGQLVVPDSFDADAISVPVEQLLADAPVATALLNERRAEYDAARLALAAAASGDEAAWSRLELAASALLELQWAMQAGQGAVRRYPDTMLPSRAGVPDAGWPLPDADCATLAQWSESASQAVVALEAQLREVYRYDVVSRNCVTEIFSTMDAAGVRPTGDVAVDSGLGFVPFVSAGVVSDRYPVTVQETLPSYRNYWLARLRESDGRARTALRESNTLTATLRHPDNDDDVFLFYTEDATVMRPLYGALNAGVGAGTMVAGLAALPFDGGHLLTRGARSFAFSVPELAFISIRKGRNGALPHAWMEQPSPTAGAGY